MKRIEFEWQGRMVAGFAEKIQGVTWLYIEGRTYCLRPEVAGRRGRGAGQADPAVIAAPMPGKISKIVRAAGSSVAEGEVVLVMEAMKMEYSLKAAMAGTIQSITVQVGDQVLLGQILANLKGAP